MIGSPTDVLVATCLRATPQQGKSNVMRGNFNGAASRFQNLVDPAALSNSQASELR